MRERLVVCEKTGVCSPLSTVNFQVIKKSSDADERYFLWYQYSNITLHSVLTVYTGLWLYRIFIVIPLKGVANSKRYSWSLF